MILFYILVWAMPLVRHPFWTDFVGELTVVKYVGGAALLYALLYLPRRKTSPSFFSTWQARCFLLFASLGIASYVLWALPTREFQESPFMSHLSFLLLFFVVIVLIDSPDRLRHTMLAVVASMTFASLHAMREWQKYGGMSADYRPGWVSGDPNFFTISALI